MSSAPGCCCAAPRSRCSRLGGELSAADQAFYEGKVASARWFTRTVLPKLAAEVQIAEATDLAIMDLPEESF